MKKKDLGRKITCTECDSKFYDLNKSPVSCPKCHHTLEIVKKIKNKKAEEEEAIIEPKNQASKKDKLESNVDPIEDLEDNVDDSILEESNNIEDEDEALGSVIVNIDNDKDSNP